MPAKKTAKPPIPRWAWIFAVSCFVIPIFTIGGAIPTALGVFSGLAALGIARRTGKPTRNKVIQCGLLTGSAWVAFLLFLFVLADVQTKHPQLQQAGNKLVSKRESSRERQEPGLAAVGSSIAETRPQRQAPGTTLESRQDIYEQATRMRFHIDSAKEQRAKLRAKGFDVTSRDEMIESLKQREQDRFDFVMGFHKISREKLDEIIAEGDRYNW